MEERVKTPDLIVFDTSTLPEYYDDVHRILSLPAGHVVTYDYSSGNVSPAAQVALGNFTPGSRLRAVLAYVQTEGYKKGDGSSETTVLQTATIQTLTRLAWIVAVRSKEVGEKVRFYLDLELAGYPNDPKTAVANALIDTLRRVGEMPMKTYVAVLDSTEVGALFGQDSDEQGFAKVVTALSHPASQFHLDTFWRITSIRCRTKSLIPLWMTKELPLTPMTAAEDERSVTYLDVVDQSTLYFTIQFQRGDEHGHDYRGRRVTVEGSPKAASDLIRSSFVSRSFGREVVAVSIPATSSLATQEIRIQFATQLHDKDEIRDYPYGPQPAIQVRYRKDVARSAMALLSIICASALFALAAFATSFSTSVPVAGIIVPLMWRALAIGLGVLLSMYAYYLWTDDIALDKVRRT
jgi:hypothetical protein